MSDENNTALKTIYAKLAEFHSQEAISMMAKYQHVEKLIGLNHHNPAAGYHCEILLKEYLRKNLPKKYSVDTGFIRCNPQPTVEDGGGNTTDYIIASPQIDILIHDNYEYTPIYKTGDCAIVEPESVAAIIEVKKNLTHAELRSALNNITESYQVTWPDRTYDPSRVFKGIFAFSSNISSKTSTLKEILTEHVAAGGVLPDCIAVIGDYFMQICWVSKDSEYCLKRFQDKEPLQNGVSLCPLQGFLFCLLDTTRRVSSERFSRFSFANMTVAENYKIAHGVHG